MQDEWTPARMKRLLEWQRRQVREQGEALANMEQQIFHRGFSTGVLLAMAAAGVAMLLYFADLRAREASQRRR